MILRSGTRLTTQLRRLLTYRQHRQIPATEFARAIFAFWYPNTSSSPFGLWFEVTKPVDNRFVILPEGKVAIIERNHRYSRTVKDAGLYVPNPFLRERIAFVYPLDREEAIPLSPFLGTVGYEGGYAKIFIDGFITLKILDPELFFYGFRDDTNPIQDILSEAQDIVLDELRGMMLFFKPSAKETLQKSKDTIYKKIKEAIDRRTEELGLQCSGCEIYDIYPHGPHPDILRSERKTQDIWKPFAEAMQELDESFCGSLASFNVSVDKAKTKVSQALKRVLIEFPPFVLQLVKECEYSKDIAKNIASASESLNWLIEDVSLAPDSAAKATTDALAKSIASVFESILESEYLIEFYSPQGTMEQLKKAHTRVSEFVNDNGGLEVASQCAADILVTPLHFTGWKHWNLYTKRSIYQLAPCGFLEILKEERPAGLNLDDQRLQSDVYKRKIFGVIHHLRSKICNI